MITTSDIGQSILAKHAFVAVFGAIVHALDAHRNKRAKNITDVLILTVISSFSGVMFSLVALHFLGDASYLTLACAGSGGFLGVEGLTLITNFVQKALRIAIDETDNDK